MERSNKERERIKVFPKTLKSCSLLCKLTKIELAFFTTHPYKKNSNLPILVAKSYILSARAP